MHISCLFGSSLSMKKVYKYGTGQEIPEGAVYLCTQVETDTETLRDGLAADSSRRDFTYQRNKFVWHYFLVDVED